MWSLGDKIASSIVAQTAGVPTMPWTGSGLKLDGYGEKEMKEGKLVSVPVTLYSQATVRTVEDGWQVS